MIDASLIPVPIQINSREENTTIKAGAYPTEWKEQPNKRRQQDTEARWTNKHGASHYGYKKHVNLDMKHKMIHQYAVTDGAVHGSQVFEDVLLSAKAGREILADSVYRSEEIETQPKAKRLRSKIHEKAAHNTPLTDQQKTCNRPYSWIRNRVEHVFDHRVSAMCGKLIRTIGFLRAKVNIELKNLT